MANTRFLKTKVEPYVRGWLAAKLGQPFHSEPLTLSGVKDRPATVSEDRSCFTPSYPTTSKER